MALQASGAISLAQIQTEFGGSNPASLSEYYRNGSYVPYHATTIPTSGAIDFADFYSASNALQITLSTQTNYNLASDLTNNHSWDGTSAIDVILTIPSGVTISATSTATPAIVVDLVSGSTLIVNNSGTIVGKGGASGAGGASGNGGGGGDGGHAVSFQDVTATVNNASGAYIRGGGGGGGGGGGATNHGSADDPESGCGGGANYNGGAGGIGAGPNAATNGSAGSSPAGTGGNGGDYGAAGANGGGGGGSGCSASNGSGGQGGDAGKAIHHVSSVTQTLNNSGTINGATS